MQPYRLGIDIGTASVACAAFALDKSRTPTGVIHCAARIFEEPLQPASGGGVGEPKKAARRIARQQRRQHHRRAGRLRKLAAMGADIGVDPRKTPSDSGQTIHQIRADAAEKAVSLPDLFRVFLHLAKRRGYMGVFREPKEKKAPVKKTAAAESDKPSRGEVREGVEGLREEIREKCGDEGTLGRYMNWRVQNGMDLRLKTHGLYADKEMVEREFDRIWKTQAANHSILREGGDALREEFRREIFFKRPLRSPAPMVGNCALEPDLPRAPMAHPAAQELRMEQAIADLEFVAPGRRRREPLSEPQREVVRKMLREKHEVKFDKMEEAMRRAECPPPDNMSFNFAKGGRDSWKKGDKTAETMRKLGFAEQWGALTPNAQTAVINLLADIGEPEIFQSDPEWHESVQREKSGGFRRFAAPVVAFINALAAHPKFGRLAAMGFDGGRDAYSVKALRNIAAKMRDGADFANAKELAYPHSVPRKGEKRKLQSRLSPPKPTGNTVVDVALRQFQRVVNAVVLRLGGPPEEIVIELSRDIALGLKKRGEIEKKIKAKERERESARREAESILDRAPSRGQVNRVLLWREQGERWCPYCDKPINLGDALDPKKTEKEHILPQSVTRIRGQRAYLVLAHESCNAEKKNKTPWQAWGDGRNPERWRIVQERAAQFRAAKLFGKSSQLLHDGDAMDAKEIGEFSNRQFQETSWIARECAAWLREICPDVMVSRGRMTAWLRHCWGLEKIIPELRYESGLPVLDKKGGVISREKFKEDPRRADKRIDHRHHIVDAIVIGLTDRSLFQRMTRLYQARTEAGEVGFGDDLEPPTMPIENLPKIARQFVADLANISHRPDRRPSGKLFDDSAYAARRDERGKLRYAKRTHLESLVGANDSEKTARRKIAEIADPKIRTAVLRVFQSRLAEGAKPGAALHGGVPHPENQTRIRRVLRFQPDQMNQNEVRVSHRARDPKNPGQRKTLQKILKPEGYAWLEMDGRGGKKLVRLHQVAAQPKRPPKGGRRFYKNDTVCGPATGGVPYVVRQMKAESGGTLYMTRITETRGANDMPSPLTLRCGKIADLLALEILNG